MGVIQVYIHVCKDSIYMYFVLLLMYSISYITYILLLVVRGTASTSNLEYPIKINIYIEVIVITYSNPELYFLILILYSQ